MNHQMNIKLHQIIQEYSQVLYSLNQKSLEELELQSEKCKVISLMGIHSSFQELFSSYQSKLFEKGYDQIKGLSLDIQEEYSSEEVAWITVMHQVLLMGKARKSNKVIQVIETLGLKKDENTWKIFFSHQSLKPSFSEESYQKIQSSRLDDLILFLNPELQREELPETFKEKESLFKRSLLNWTPEEVPSSIIQTEKDYYSDKRDRTLYERSEEKSGKFSVWKGQPSNWIGDGIISFVDAKQGQESDLIIEGGIEFQKEFYEFLSFDKQEDQSDVIALSAGYLPVSTVIGVNLQPCYGIFGQQAKKRLLRVWKMALKKANQQNLSVVCITQNLFETLGYPVSSLRFLLKETSEWVEENSFLLPKIVFCVDQKSLYKKIKQEIQNVEKE